MTMTGTGTVERRETASLIGSDKVDGTAVYGSDQKRIGSIQRVMIDKISGKVAYAVMSFGGFLGIGEVACTRFRRHRVRCFDGTGGASWRGGSSRESSSLRQCA